MHAVHPAEPQSPPAAPPAWVGEQRARFESHLADVLDAWTPMMQGPSQLAEAVAYSLRQRGKRVRPILVLECARLAGADGPAALTAAIAVECVHTFSLIHDDLPAMDDDDLRRGEPTNHKVFGEATALLAGDWLLARALHHLAIGEFPDQRRAEALAALALGCEGMIVGQAADIAGQGREANLDRVRYVHTHKTARLIESACRLGALAVDAPAALVQALGAFGVRLGLAFQIVDDVLDCTASTEQLGKRAGKDDSVRKLTYPGAIGLEPSRRAAAQEMREACALLDGLGERADRLREIARYVVGRVH